MLSPATGPLRLVRAAVLVAVTVALATLAHLLGGGAPPSVTAVAAIGGLAFAPAVLLTGRRLRPGTALGALAAGQLVVHEAFGLLGRAACAVPGGSPGPHAGHGVAAASDRLAALSAGPPTACARPLVDAALGGHAMVVAHVVATVATGLVLAGGERALWWLAAWLRPLVRRPSVAAPVVLPRLVVARTRAGTRGRSQTVAWSLRGPPRARLAPA